MRIISKIFLLLPVFIAFGSVTMFSVAEWRYGDNPDWNYQLRIKYGTIVAIVIAGCIVPRFFGHMSRLISSIIVISTISSA